MFTLSEETSTKQIFEQTLSLLTIKFSVLRCQSTKRKKEKYIRYNILQLQLTTNPRRHEIIKSKNQSIK